MKRFVFLVMMVAAVMFSLSIAHCEAKDVWVDRWQNSNADIYVMDETLAWEENLNGKFFRVTTKEVQNGKVQGYHKRGAERKSETLHQVEICKTRTGNVAL